MIRQYKGTDFDRIIALWNKALPEHSVDRRAFVKNVLLDMNMDPNGFLVAEENGEIIGFVWAVVRRYPVDVGAPSEEEKSYINILALDEEKPEKFNTGRALLTAAEEYIRSKGKKLIVVSGYSPNYVYPGLTTARPDYIELFESMGYVAGGGHYSIGIDLLRFGENKAIEELKRKREEEGYQITPLTDALVVDLMNYTFPGWTHRFRRLINETMDYDKVRLVLKDGAIIGCAVFGDPYSSDERFGPYGVSAEYRGLGLGKLLLYDTLMAMKRRGLRHAWAQSTPSDGAAFTIYERMGFVRTDLFITYRKELS